MQNLSSKIFLDSSDPIETKKALQILGSLDGQTTNPSLVAKNPQIQEFIKAGKKFLNHDLIAEYKLIINQILEIIPNGSVSIEVYCDNSTTYSEILSQAEDMQSSIPKAHIKIPANREGLKAAEIFIKNGGKVNMTLCFSQAQASAVEIISRNAKEDSVIYSSFVGRLFDNKINGLRLLEICLDLYKKKNSNVQVLAASFRSLDQILACFKIKTDIVTIPYKYIQEWEGLGLKVPSNDFIYLIEDDIEDIKVENIQTDDWRTLPIENELTKIGIDLFSSDWNKLISN
jgi:transaldolase